ncbi:MAG: glutamate-1-semialdehyde 2,1-aminomutase, partial [Tannerella sp.]|nr:glutamate-1-semialdehyde 2,1-aminomutase [Tannerella sp.]
MMNRQNSREAYREALRYIPGGVNSPVRALKSVGEEPLFIRKARGCRLTDVDGNRFTDFCLSWGVFILGHGAAPVNEAVRKAIANGTSYGIPSLPETALARSVNRCIPSMERTRFVNSGTEAVMSAIRLARGYTGRNLIVKFDGCYHGHADHLLVAAGSGVAGLGGSSSAGVPDGFVACTVSLPFNDREAVNRTFRARGSDIAAVIVEPVPANMGVVLPRDGFLQHLRDVTAQNGSLLIFDEVITGLRLSRGGAQELFGITPDLTTVGKIVGGGFPAAAFGGRRDIMSLLAPDGPVYQAGTLSGNPVAMTAGLTTLSCLEDENFYTALN